MPKRVFVYPYKMGSAASKALAEGLGVRRIYRDRKYKYRDGDVIINYGMTVPPDGMPANAVHAIVNRPSAVGAASNKLSAFTTMAQSGVSIPDFTTDQSEARRWITDDHSIVVCRTVLNGHSGGGIVLASVPEEVVEAPLYTRYVKKKHEYRVHVGHGIVFDIAQKRVRQGSEGNNFQVRNYDNGWVFTRDGVDHFDAVHEQAVLAVAALGLDFGAVDIGYNTHTGVATVYEVNTAPGLEGTTLSRYVSMIQDNYL